MGKQLRRTLRNVFQVTVLSHLGALFLWILFLTLRWKKNDLLSLRVAGPAIFAFWHGRQLMLAPLFAKSIGNVKTAVLISEHRDGLLISRVISWFGLDTIQGSSTRGGSKAFREMIQKSRSGISIAVTPDGPKGPPYKIKDGLIRLAQTTGLPLYCVSVSADRVWRFKSWDQMILPKPFARAVCTVSEPMLIQNSKELPELRLATEEALNSITKLSDELVK